MFLQVKKNIILSQWYAGIGVILLLLQLGLMTGWPSPTLARLTGQDSPIPISEEEASWIASLINVGRFFGAIIGSFVMDYFGSKRSIFITGLPIALSWLAIALANTVEILYFARLIAGVGIGMMLNIFPIYVGEVSMPKTRGAIISFAGVGGPLGMLIASVSSSYLNLTVSSCIYCACAIVLLAMFLWLPESPHHLIKVQDRTAAEKSINWYRAGINVKKELEDVEKFVNNCRNSSFVDKLQEFRKPALRRAIIQIICLFSLQQLCGLNSIYFYMEMILVKANFTLFDPSLVFVYSNIGGIFSSVLTIILIERCGRKFLLLLSSALVTFCCLGLTIYFLLIEMSVNMEQYQWIPMLSVIAYNLCYSVGMFPVPNTLLSEIFPANIKCIASCIAALTGGITSFISAKTYQPMVHVMGETYVFLIYAVLSAVVIPYTLLVVPETKGKSLQQIQDEMMAS